MKIKKKCIRKIRGDVKSAVLDEIIGINTADKITLKEELRKEIKAEVNKQTPNKYIIWLKRLGITYLLIMYTFSKITSVQGLDDLTLIEIIKLFVSF